MEGIYIQLAVIAVILTVISIQLNVIIKKLKGGYTNEK